MPLVNGLNEARAAIRAGARALISPPYAACHAGVGYYVALIKLLREEFPDNDFTFTLCCGDNPAIAHDALRLGITSIVCRCSDAIADQLRVLGTILMRAYPHIEDDK